MRRIGKIIAAVLFSISLHADETTDCTIKWGPYFSAGPVYWRADGNGLGFAVKSDSTTTLSPHARVCNLNFDWDFGLEALFGWRVPHDSWSLSLGVKAIHTNAHGQQSAHSGEALYPVWTLPETGSSLYADWAHAHWRIHLGLLDFLVSKEWTTSFRLAITPQIGIRTAWIRQKYNLEYQGGTLVPDREFYVRMKNKFWGIGPAIGLDGNWEFIRRFSLFANALFSLLYGEYYLHQDEDTFEERTKLLGLHSTFTDSAATLDLALGLRWSDCYRGTLKKVVVELGWDQIFLYKQNQLIRFMNGNAKGLFVSNQGDITLSGVHLTAAFHF